MRARKRNKRDIVSHVGWVGKGVVSVKADPASRSPRSSEHGESLSICYCRESCVESPISYLNRLPLMTSTVLFDTVWSPSMSGITPQSQRRSIDYSELDKSLDTDKGIIRSGPSIRFNTQYSRSSNSTKSAFAEDSFMCRRRANV